MSGVDAARRGFLKLGGTAVSGSWLVSHWPALLAVAQTACVSRDKQAAFAHLTSTVAADLAAIAAQIIPTDDTPGADEAGVIYFIDGSFDTVMTGAKGFVEEGLAQLNARVSKKHPNKRFADIDSGEQHALLQAEEQSPFFSTLRFLTIAGMFAMSTHGGNRDQVGWDLLQFDARHSWQPPFGDYDDEDTSVE